MSVRFAVFAFLTIGTLIFPSAGWDDAYITYWAAHALSDLGRIVNVNGDVIEQSSSLGLVIIIAAFRRVTGVDAALIGRLVSIAFGAATIWATASLGRRVNPAAGRWSPVLVATCTYFIYWSFGGMEASLAALSGVVILVLLITILDETGGPGSLPLMAGVSVVFVSSRPESALILGATLVGLASVLMVRRWRRVTPESWEVRTRRALPRVILVAAAAIGTVVLFRFWYFGQLFPQPVYVKAHALSKQKIFNGLLYVLDSASSDFLLIALLGGLAAGRLIISAVVSGRRTSAEIVTAVYLVASVSFIVMSGGDGMHGGRFFLPVVPAAVVLGVSLMSKALPPRLLQSTVIVWVAVQLAGAFVFARTQSHSDPVWAVATANEAGFGGRFDWFERANHDHRRYQPVVIALEREIDRALVHRKPVTILSGQSGFVMYHVARTHPGVLKYVDRFALVTRDFSDCPISSGLPHTEWGLLVTTRHYLTGMEAFDQQCGIARPDIIFELFSELTPELHRALKAAGYIVTYSQGDDLVAGSRLLPGQPAGGVYIAVRQALPR